jgi:hypothetical protein
MAADKGADAATSANDKTLAAQERMYNTQRADFAPYQQLGENALPSYYKMLGITPTLSQQEQDILKSYNDWNASQGVSQTGTSTAQVMAQAPVSRPIHNLSGDALGNDDPNNNFQQGTLTAQAPQPVAAWSGDMEALKAAQQKQALVNSVSGLGEGAPELSPLAQWQQQQASRSKGLAESARGISTGGGAATRAADLTSSIAAQDYQNQYARILDALKIGTGASSAAGGASQQFSSQIGQAGANQGNIALNQEQSEANLWSGLGSIPMDYYNFTQKQPQTQVTPSAFGAANPGIAGGTYGGSSQYGTLI